MQQLSSFVEAERKTMWLTFHELEGEPVSAKNLLIGDPQPVEGQ